MKLTHWIQQAWAKKYSWLSLLLPLTWLYGYLARRKYRYHQTHPAASYQASVPVVIVGNITVGGTGKTPMILWLIDYCQRQQLKVGVISRGYGAKPAQYPWLVQASDSPAAAGDEPLLIVQRSGVPMAIDPDRSAAARYLTEHYQLDLILADDGLQHYKLARDLELVLIDGQRQLGNQRCLPCGPLREPASRLETVDAVLVNGTSTDANGRYGFQVQAQRLVNLKTGQTVAADHFAKQAPVHAMAGIGNPQRFFNTLTELGYVLTEHAFADHAVYSLQQLSFADDKLLIMTEKDAVKCRAFAADNWWYLAVDAVPSAGFVNWWSKQLAILLSHPREEYANGSKIT